MTSAIDRLRVTHHLALRAQHASDLNSAALMRAWPDLATAAHDAYSLIPSTPGGDDRIAERIALDASSLSQAPDHVVWPGDTAPDQALLQVTAGFRAATVALARKELPAHESIEARRLIISSLWTTSRLLGQATRDMGYNLSLENGESVDRRTLITGLTQDAHRRFSAIEQLAANGLRTGDTHQNPASHLRQAIATWDIEAHRALLNDRSTAVLHVLAHQEAASVNAFQTFAARAAAEGILDPTTQNRLLPVLADSSKSWAALRDVAAEFSFSSTVVPVSFINAATELREQFYNSLQPAGPAQRTAILSALSGHLASAVTISGTARDLINEGELRAPARAIARIMSEQRPDILQSLVSIRDVRRGVSVPLPLEARQLLAGPATRAFHDADESLSRAAGLDAVRAVPPRALDQAIARLGNAKILPLSEHSPKPAPGCAL